MTHRSLTLSCLLLVALPASGCTDYWWQRGQPPSVKTLMSRATTDLETAIAAKKRSADLVQLAKTIESCTKQAAVESGAAGNSPSTKLSEALGQCKQGFVSLEDHISVTNRAPYAELSGQLRVFVDASSKGEKLDPSAVGLFAARTLFFLASELELSAPVANS